MDSERRYTANTAAPEVKFQERIQQEIQKRRMTALLNLTKSPDFKVFWAWLQERTNITAEVFHGNSRDIYDKGKRAVGLMVLQDLLRLGEPGLQFKHDAEMQYMRDQQLILALVMDLEKEANRK